MVGWLLWAFIYQDHQSYLCIKITNNMIRFAAITLNLGPTFLSGTMAANVNHRPREPSCPLVQVWSGFASSSKFLQGPYRHYILNFLWILMNLMCILITLYHLVKLYRDYSTTSADSVRQTCIFMNLISVPSSRHPFLYPLCLAISQTRSSQTQFNLQKFLPKLETRQEGANWQKLLTKSATR